jgi:hypothetical protein
MTHLEELRALLAAGDVDGFHAALTAEDWQAVNRAVRQQRRENQPGFQQRRAKAFGRTLADIDALLERKDA